MKETDDRMKPDNFRISAQPNLVVNGTYERGKKAIRLCNIYYTGNLLGSQQENKKKQNKKLFATYFKSYELKFSCKEYFRLFSTSFGFSVMENITQKDKHKSARWIKQHKLLFCS